MKKEIVPNGSVVLLKEGTKRLMVVGWYPVAEDGTKYDYMGAFYPEGFINLDHIFLFNHEDIDTLEFVGYVDAEFQLFAQRVTDELSKLADEDSAEIKSEIEADQENSDPF